jgi:hypothetical protein
MTESLDTSPSTSIDAARRDVLRTPADPRGCWRLAAAHGPEHQTALALWRFRTFLLDPGNFHVAVNAMSALRVLEREREVPKWLPRTRLNLPQPQRLEVDLPPLVAAYHRLLAEMNRRRDEDWTPLEIEVAKFSMPLTAEILASFRRSEVSGGTQTAPDRPVDFPFLDYDRFYPALTEAEIAEHAPLFQRNHAAMLFRLAAGALKEPGNRDRRYAIGVLDAVMGDDDRFGARLFNLPGFGVVTNKSMQAAYYAARTAALIPKRGSVLEIGGGFGAVAMRLLRVRPDVSYVLTDLPVNMVMTYAYLRSHFGDQVYGAFEGPIRPPKGTRVMIVPPWRLNEIGGRISLAINTMSFQHMDERNHRFYGDQMRRLSVETLYHLNRQDIRPGDITVRIHARDYSFLDQFEVISDEPFQGRWIEVVARRRAAG